MTAQVHHELKKRSASAPGANEMERR
jgi:hypothetical protein